jgi:hypothetical protein
MQKVPFFGVDKFGRQMRGNYPYGAHPEPDRSPDAAQRQGQNAARNADLQGSEAAAGYGVNNNYYKPYRVNSFESKNMSKEQKCTECGMWESKCSCTDELAEMLKLSGLMKPYVAEAKKKKPDANKDGIPDYAQDGKGKMEEGKKVDEADVEEGNEFSGELAKAKASGQKEFEVDGKKYQVKETTSADLMKRWTGIFETEEKCADCGEVHTGDCKEESKETVEEDTGKFDKKDTTWTDKSGKQHPAQRVTRKTDDLEQGKEDDRRAAKTMPGKKDKKPLGESMEECMDGGAGGMEDNFSINSSMDSTGHKSVSINATGSKADELTAILKNAGLGVMGGGDEEHVEIGHDDHGDMGGDVEVVSVPLAQHDGYEAPEHEEEMDETYSNEPHAQVQPVSTQMHQGNDLNAEKAMHKRSYRQGDNPMAMEQIQALEKLERDLMEELAALKVVSEKYMGFDKTAKAVGSPALAAWIGRKKYGKEKFQKAAAAGKKLG